MNVGAPVWSSCDKIVAVKLDAKFDILKDIFGLFCREIGTEQRIELRKRQDNRRDSRSFLLRIKDSNWCHIFFKKLSSIKSDWQSLAGWLPFCKARNCFRENTVRHLSFTQIIEAKSRRFENHALGVFINFGISATHSASKRNRDVIASNYDVRLD